MFKAMYGTKIIQHPIDASTPEMQHYNTVDNSSQYMGHEGMLE